MIVGIAFAIAACGLWALAFVSPVVLEGFSPFLVTLGRYGAFGLISLVLALFFSREVRKLKPMDWGTAAVLSGVGNIVYYAFLASAIQLIDVTGPTTVIGLLPLTIPLLANWRRRELPWRALIMPLLTIGLGLFLVNAYEYQRFEAAEDPLTYAAGIGLAIAALVCWTWYGVANASWLRPRPHVTAVAWTVAQGVTILPLVTIGVAGWIPWNSIRTTAMAVTNTDALGRFLLVSAIVGLASSWLATFCWSHASRILLTTLAGQLLVFETIAAIIYGHVYRERWPAVAIALGVALLCGGVALGVRAVQNYPTTAT